MTTVNTQPRGPIYLVSAVLLLDTNQPQAKPQVQTKARKSGAQSVGPSFGTHEPDQVTGSAALSSEDAPSASASAPLPSRL